MIKSIRLFIILCTAISFGQDHTVNGEISPVKEDGLFNIPIPHSVRSYAASDLRDLRIWDTEGNQVPYFINSITEYEETKVSNFKQFSIVSRSKIKDSSATYIFKNPNKTIEQAVFLVANYQGSKSYRIEGSNNQKQWFGIVNRGNLSNLNHPKKTSTYKVINFPLCSYKYLKVVFNDSHTLPINLLKIGEAITETRIATPIVMEKIPVKAIEFLEKGKITQIHIRFERPEVVNQLRLDITAPSLYSRKATCYTLKEQKVKRNIESYRQHLSTFSIRSDEDLVFDIPKWTEKEIYIEIDNKDNPKLEISGVHFTQKPIHVAAFLKAGKTYKITAGNKTLNFPNYDISDVTNKAKNALPIAPIKSVAAVQPEEKSQEAASFWLQSWFMWCCIAVAAVMISYFAFNLVKDLDKSKEQ